MKKQIRIIAQLMMLLGFILGSQLHSVAQTETDVDNEFQLRTRFDASYKFNKKLKLEFTPEVRWDEGLNVDRYQIETGLSYRPIKYFWLGASYRFIVNPRENKETEYLNRYSLHATFKKSYERWTPSFRLMYTDFTEEVQDGNFLRYKGRLNYNIKDFALTPHIAVEGFQELSSGEFYKMRYTLGAKYKLFKNNHIQLDYKLDYFLKEFQNKHIVALSYKLKF